jgi:hypothetical protein
MKFKDLLFKKESSGRWFIDYPDWTGDKSDLEMVYGADSFLEVLSDGLDYVRLTVSDEYFEGSDVLNFVRNSDELENGAFYFLESYLGQKFDLEMWLCDVTVFVLGTFPEKIYFSKIN